MAAANGEQPDSFSPYRADGKLLGFVCIVTGATQPIGRAIVAELVVHGAACVYACSSTPDDDFASLEKEVKQQYPDSSTKIIGYPFKLANEEDTLGLIDDVLNAWGRYVIYCRRLLSSLSGCLPRPTDGPIESQICKTHRSDGPSIMC